jgi:hypothetical protein
MSKSSSACPLSQERLLCGASSQKRMKWIARDSGRSLRDLRIRGPDLGRPVGLLLAPK